MEELRKEIILTKASFSEPTLRLIRFDTRDILTRSPSDTGVPDPNAGTWVP